ncbi:hypothetical protein HK097_000411 [Rhizophlyctis rosea]|uniref:Uncharacterized protein n=1 Tax=Rhizophlyctis rosea TaxID=64517 RepID=A0AAD5X212_9FUNG|nr:hypothetical protein HK097_000411 [Rhizophlyctis rosea]
MGKSTVENRLKMGELVVREVDRFCLFFYMVDTSQEIVASFVERNAFHSNKSNMLMTLATITRQRRLPTIIRGDTCAFTLIGFGEGEVGEEVWYSAEESRRLNLRYVDKNTHESISRRAIIPKDLVAFLITIKPPSYIYIAGTSHLELLQAFAQVINERIDALVGGTGQSFTIMGCYSYNLELSLSGRTGGVMLSASCFALDNAITGVESIGAVVLDVEGTAWGPDDLARLLVCSFVFATFLPAYSHGTKIIIDIPHLLPLAVQSVPTCANANGDMEVCFESVISVFMKISSYYFDAWEDYESKSLKTGHQHSQQHGETIASVVEKAKAVLIRHSLLSEGRTLEQVLESFVYRTVDVDTKDVKPNRAPEGIDWLESGEEGKEQGRASGVGDVGVSAGSERTSKSSSSATEATPSQPQPSKLLIPSSLERRKPTLNKASPTVRSSSTGVGAASSFGTSPFRFPSHSSNASAQSAEPPSEMESHVQLISEGVGRVGKAFGGVEADSGVSSVEKSLAADAKYAVSDSTKRAATGADTLQSVAGDGTSARSPWGLNSEGAGGGGEAVRRSVSSMALESERGGVVKVPPVSSTVEDEMEIDMFAEGDE